MALQVAAQMPGVNMCLFKLIGANMNVTTDQPLVPLFGVDAVPLTYVLDRILVTNASASLTTAAGGVYNAVSKPGAGILVAAAQAYSTLTGATLGLNLTLTALASGAQSTVPVFSLTTGQGSAATADIYAFGRIMVGV